MSSESEPFGLAPASPNQGKPPESLYVLQPSLMKLVGHDVDAYSLLLSTEIIVEIFSLLPSFTEVLALSSACARFRSVWIANVNHIFSHVSQRSIPCRPHALILLADQRGPSIDLSLLSTGDVHQIIRNARIVDQAVIQFEREIVCNVHSEWLLRVSKARPKFLSSSYLRLSERLIDDSWGPWFNGVLRCPQPPA